MDVEVGAVEQADRSAAGGKLACGRAEVQGDGASVAQAEGGASLAQPVCQGSWIWHETEASGWVAGAPWPKSGSDLADRSGHGCDYPKGMVFQYR